jgi:hypothetical protein
MYWKQLSSEKVGELRITQEFCVKMEFKCLLVNGPIHEDAFIDLSENFEKSFKQLNINSKFFRFDT